MEMKQENTQSGQNYDKSALLIGVSKNEDHLEQFQILEDYVHEELIFPPGPEVCATCYKKIAEPSAWFSCDYVHYKFYFCGIRCMKDFAVIAKSKFQDCVFVKSQ